MLQIAGGVILAIVALVFFPVIGVAVLAAIGFVIQHWVWILIIVAVAVFVPLVKSGGC